MKIEASEFGLDSILEKSKPLNKEVQRELLLKFFKTRDKGIKEELILANLRFIIFILNKDFYTQFGVSKNDLFQAGVFGLDIAIEKFNPKEFDNEFSTYAGFWIKAEIQKEIGKIQHSVSIPKAILTNLGTISRAKSLLESKLLREPTQDEIFQETGLTKIVFDTVMQFKSSQTNQVRLDDKIGEDGDSIGSIIKGKSVDFNKNIINEQQNLFIEKLMNSSLKDKEKKIIEICFGINGNDKKNYREAGKIFGITGERVRQIENSCLKKMNLASGFLNLSKKEIKEYI